MHFAETQLFFFLLSLALKGNWVVLLYEWEVKRMRESNSIFTQLLFLENHQTSYYQNLMLPSPELKDLFSLPR